MSNVETFYTTQRPTVNLLLRDRVNKNTKSKELTFNKKKYHNLIHNFNNGITESDHINRLLLLIR